MLRPEDRERIDKYGKLADDLHTDLHECLARFPQGQNERKANFGTAVESCSKKLPDCRSLATATFLGNRNQLFHKKLPDFPHLLLPLFREIYNQLFS